MKTIQTIIFMFLCGISLLCAQEPKENWQLNSTESGNKTYIARDYISLKPGFSYQATSGNKFNAKIDPALLFPPSGNTYMKPDGTITSDLTQGSVVGSIPGTFEVSPMGAATYTVPIVVPEGINGLQPNISLVYNSQSGNGVAGWAWNLSGTSAITQGAKNIFSDEAVSGIDLSAKSDYYLDGNKLFVKTGSTYGAINAEYETENRTYVQIKQTVSVNSYPSRFTVTDKNGTVMEYGHVVKLQNSTYPFQWLLSKVTDANGNFVKYVYKTNTNKSQTVLDYIEYGSNGSTAAPLKIMFTYEEKSYVQKQWVSGYYFEDYHLLQNIAVKNSQTQLRKYSLTYAYRDNKHFLTGIKLTNENDESLPETTIDWGEDNKTLDVKNKSATSSNPNTMAFFSDDITEDGISDLIEMKVKDTNTMILKVYQASDTGDCEFTQFGNSKEFPVSLTDAKGNMQEAEKYMVVRHYNKKWISLLVSNANNTYFSLYDATNTDDNLNTKSILLPPGIRLSLLHTIADFNNDGNDEILYVYKGISLSFNFFFGKMFYLKQDLSEDHTPENIFSSASNNISDTPRHIFSADFNADGLTDVAILGHNGIYIYRNNGGTKQDDGMVHVEFSHAKTVSLSMSDNEAMVKGGDFNGDGLLDFILYDGNENFKLIVSDGSFGFNTYSLSSITMKEDTGTTANDKKDDFIVTDFNHDGKSDLIVIDVQYTGSNYSSTAVTWFVSTGTNFTLTKYNSFINEQYYYQGYATTGDFDGDGREDLFSYSANLYNSTQATQKRYFYRSFNTNFCANLVTGIKNGMNVWQNIEYQPLTRSEDFYTKGSDSGYGEDLDFHIADIQAPLYCVKQTNRQWYDNQKGWLSVDGNTYSYEGLKMQTQGKGLLGFIVVSVVNEENATVTRTENNYDYEGYKYCIPRVRTQTVLGTIEGLVSQVQNSFLTAKSGKIITTLPGYTEEQDYLAGLSKKTDYLSYDEFGNLTKQKITQGEHVQIDTVTYIQRGAWCVNKPDYTRTIASYQSLQDTVIKTFEYDTKGNLTKEILYPDKPLFKVTTEYANYDTFGHPRTIRVKAKDKDGTEQTRTSYVDYTSSGRFTNSKTNLLSETTTYTWDETRGLIDYETNHWGKVTDYTYDGWGNLRETRYPDGNRKTAVLQWAVSTSGKPSGAVYYSYAQTSGSAPVITWYDAAGYELQKDSYGLSSNKISISTEYNDKLQLHRVSEPYFAGTTTIPWAQTYTYDEYGRTRYRQTPLGTDTILYNSYSRTTTVMTPEDTKITTLNTSGFTASNTVNGKTVSYVYYPNGLLKTATPADGQALTMEYDPNGNRTKLNDPDAGTIETRYNGFGELVEEKQKIHSASAWITTTNNYAPTTGLLQSIVRNGETTSYTYDSSLGHPGRIQSITQAGQHKQSFTYDDLGRTINVREEIDGRTYNRGTEYDALGRVKKDIYPSGYYTVNHYNQNGMFYKVTDRNERHIWEAKTENARGQLLSEKKGNKETTYSYYDTGHPEFIYAGGIIDNLYEFDERGNLTYRDEITVSGYPNEHIQYDAQNRLINRDIYSYTYPYGESSMYCSLTYDAQGNIQTKSDLGSVTMNYGANGKPHALTSISGTPANFPANNLSVTYTDFKKIKTLTEGNKNYTLTYGVDDQRRKSVYKENSTPKETCYYIGDYEEKINNSTGLTQKIHYLPGAIYIENSNGTTKFYYAYTDILGSLTALVNENGTVAERYAYDPWGRRRDPDDWVLPDTRTSFLVNRGYTMHEHLDQFGIINMNGRVYDPLTASFFSPDPYVQASDNWLNYNRYTYCLNNPFKYTDPSGNNPLIMAIFFSAFMNTAFQGISGNINSAGDLLKSMGIGALSGLAGYGAGSLVSGAIKFGGFAAGSLIGAAGGAAGGFVGGVGNAWANDASFGEGLKAGLIGGGIGTLTGGIAGGLSRGISDYKNGYDFWDGSKISKYTVGTSSTDKTLAKALAENYNANNLALEGNDATLQGRTLDEFNIKEGTGGLAKLTTKVPKKFGLTNGGVYMDLKTGEHVGGYTYSYSSGFSDVYIADRFAIGDIVSFKAVVGHELIHVYHNYKFLPVMTGSAYHNHSYDINTERVAYQYTYRTYLMNGRISDAINTYNIARSLNYWGSYPAQYITPYQYPFIY